MSIKESFEKTEKLYHFTTLEKALKIIDSNRLRFGRLSNMNDIHEADKIMFVDADGHSIDKFPSDVLDALHNEVYSYRQISLTAEDEEVDKDGFDLHQMWGLYADKGEGVCLVFDRKELEKGCDIAKVRHERVKYDEDIESFVISDSQSPEAVIEDVRDRIPEIFFHKRKEWEHEQEYRLIKRCQNAIEEEYLLLGHALKFVILSSKLRNIDEVRYFKNIEIIKDKAKKVEEARNVGKAGAIPVLVYGNGLFDYSLATEDGEEELWNSKEGYDILVLGENCELAL